MFEKLLSLMSFNDIEDEDNYDDYYEEEPEVTAPRKTNSSASSSKKRAADSSQREEKQPSPFEQARKERAAKYDRQSKVVPYKKDNKAMEVCVRKPDSYSDAEQICDLLLDGNPVIVNFEGFDSYEAQRTMEFICGCIYALNGDMNQISKYIFIFSPAGVDIMGDIVMDDGTIPTFNNNF